MFGKESSERKLWAVPLQACVRWLVCAALLLLVFSLLLAHSAGSSRQLAYTSSAVSFLAAIPVGWFLVRQLKGKRLLLGFLAGLILCLLLLLVGFLIDAESMSKDAVLSFSSFTLAGALTGSLPGGNGSRMRSGRRRFFQGKH